MPADQKLEPQKFKFRKRCRYCHKLFETNQAGAKFCPQSRPAHRWLFFKERNPRIKLTEKTVQKRKRRKK